MMMTIFAYLFIAALAILAFVLFMHLLIPIVVIGLLILGFETCGELRNGRTVEPPRAGSVESGITMAA
jgi:hypothetical protein